jgi:inorganic pyrophosphatase
MNVRIFIQNEAGSNLKHYHDEKTLEWKRVATVSARYPFPYGFVVGTTAADGGNADCFVITEEPLRTGQLVDGRVAGLMEQIEDGEEDHNVLAILPGSARGIAPEDEERLTAFVRALFAHAGGKRVEVGRFLGAGAAEAYITARLDRQ